MKYTIVINQYAAVKNGLDLDLVDLSIFDFIKDFANSQSCIKMQTPEGFFFWVSHKLIIESMPLLKIKTPQGIIKRIDNLIKSDLLIKHPNCEMYAKTLYSFGKNYDLLMFRNSDILDDERKLQPPNESLGYPPTNVYPPPNESLGDNNIIYNNISDNSNYVDSSLFPDEDKKIEDQKKKEEDAAKQKELAEKRKSIFEKSDVYKAVNFNVSPADYSKFEAMFDSEKYAPVDLVFYFNAVKDWSDKSDNVYRTKRGWLATVRTFIANDLEKKKLRVKQQYATENPGIDIASAMSFLTDNY